IAAPQTGKIFRPLNLQAHLDLFDSDCPCRVDAPEVLGSSQPEEESAAKLTARLKYHGKL
ncbi:MAG TPA: hypothetical protein VGS41_05365, partial [Chthonomonadales bacterium]|nr:hypothetical protein [Chthonomonadales bacterium]